MKRVAFVGVVLCGVLAGCAQPPQPASPPSTPPPAPQRVIPPAAQPTPTPASAPSAPPSSPTAQSSSIDAYFHQAMRSSDMVAQAVNFNDSTTLNDVLEAQATIRQAQVDMDAIPVPSFAVKADMLLKQAFSEAESGTKMAEVGMRLNNPKAYGQGATHFANAQDLFKRAATEMERLQKQADSAPGY